MEITPSFDESPFDAEVKEYILVSLRPFVPHDDAMGTMFYGVLRKMLKRADHATLASVVIEVLRFADDMRVKGFHNEPDVSRAFDQISGQSAVSGPESERKINAGEIPYESISQGIPPADETQMATVPDTSSRYETPMAGDADSNRPEGGELVSQNGTGGHT
jgi:hypothetical protein